MTLSALKAKLKVTTGTQIGDVYFDWQAYLNEVRDKVYPVVLWQLDGSKFTEDLRTSTIQKVRILTLNVYGIAFFELDNDPITVWDTLEAKLKVYMNAVNAMSGLQIANIDKISGQYASEGLMSADREIGIIYNGVQLKISC